MRRIRGGIGKLSEALCAACKAAGGEVRTSTRVERIIVEGGTAKGVVVMGSEIRAKRVVSSADPRRTFFQLMDPSEMSPEFARKVGNIRYKGQRRDLHQPEPGVRGAGL
jgi:phytoene dehydrogenase-like protein